MRPPPPPPGRLSGRRIVVTRAPEQARDLARSLAREGARVIYLPLISIGDPESWDRVDAAIRGAASGVYDWILFASTNAVGRFLGRTRALGLELRARIGAVGPTTAEALGALGVEVDVVPESFTAAHLAEAVGPGEGRILLPRVEGGPIGPVEELENRGWVVDEVATYRNVPASSDSPEADEVRAGGFDALTLMSGSAAENLAAVLGNPSPIGLAPNSHEARVVVCIGPKTAQAARRAGLRVDLVAQEHTAAGLVAALVRWFS